MEKAPRGQVLRAFAVTSHFDLTASTFLRFLSSAHRFPPSTATTCSRLNLVCPERPCSVDPSLEDDILNRSTRVWSFERARANGVSLQAVVDCTETGDSIELPSSPVVQPEEQISIWRDLTVGHSLTSDTSLAASMTCPRAQALFLVRYTPDTHPLAPDCCLLGTTLL